MHELPKIVSNLFNNDISFRFVIHFVVIFWPAACAFFYSFCFALFAKVAI